MKTSTRLGLAAGFILFDWITFFAPFGALFVAYVLVFNPKWVLNFLQSLDEVPPERVESGT